MDPAVHRTMVRTHGWSQEELAAWVERIALAELVGQGPGWARSTRCRPSSGVHHSTTRRVACSSRWVRTTSVMSARNECAPSVPVELRAAGDLGVAGPWAWLVARVGRRRVECEAGVPRRSGALRSEGIEPKVSSPSVKDASMPLIRGEPSGRSVAIVLCRWASKRIRTRCARSGAASSTSLGEVIARGPSRRR